MTQMNNTTEALTTCATLFKLPKTKGEFQSFQKSRAKWQSHRRTIRTTKLAPFDTNLGHSEPTDQKLNPIRERLVAFYSQHCPAKLKDDACHLDQVLKKYRGKEEILFQKLEAKYVKCNFHKFPIPEKFDPQKKHPKCYLDIRIGNDEKTKHHRLEIQLYDNIVPLAAENFRCLCTGEKGVGKLSGKALHYKGSKFHRIIPKFMIQGGDFTKFNGTGGESIYSGTTHGDMWGKFKDETFLSHSRSGLLSYANSGPHGNGSQFFITLKSTPHLDGKHVVFGEVVRGAELLEEISNVDCDKSNKPLHANEVVIEDCGELELVSITSLTTNSSLASKALSIDAPTFATTKTRDGISVESTNGSKCKDSDSSTNDLTNISKATHTTPFVTATKNLPGNKTATEEANVSSKKALDKNPFQSFTFGNVGVPKWPATSKASAGLPTAATSIGEEFGVHLDSSGCKTPFESSTSISGSSFDFTSSSASKSEATVASIDSKNSTKTMSDTIPSSTSCLPMSQKASKLVSITSLTTKSSLESKALSIDAPTFATTKTRDDSSVESTNGSKCKDSDSSTNDLTYISKATHTTPFVTVTKNLPDNKTATEEANVSSKKSLDKNPFQSFTFGNVGAPKWPATSKASAGLPTAATSIGEDFGVHLDSSGCKTPCESSILNISNDSDTVGHSKTSTKQTNNSEISQLATSEEQERKIRNDTEDSGKSPFIHRIERSHWQC